MVADGVNIALNKTAWVWWPNKPFGFLVGPQRGRGKDTIVLVLEKFELQSKPCFRHFTIMQSGPQNLPYSIFVKSEGTTFKNVSQIKYNVELETADDGFSLQDWRYW